ncbi:hypothetical protein AX16_003767 [Volvariella volvacea WC 439]|nr:hypothetical protein AX16_003767 [Volvariella volvacea WC 439]
MDTSSDKLLVEPRQTDGAGYGLYALKNCDPSTPLFVIPASALINIKTLEPHYPRTAKKLTAVQLVSLHLFLHRPQAGAPSGDALFGPYISTLPQDFDAHPLTWLTRQKLGVENEPEVTLLKKIPESVRCDLEQIASKFDADWNACRAFLVRSKVHVYQ